MASRTVYDADGKAYEVEAVDAREYIKSGHYFAAAPVKEDSAQESEGAASDDGAMPEAKRRGRPPKA